MVGIVITTHGKLATTFLDVAESVLGNQEAVVAVDVMPQEGKDEILQHLAQAVSRVRVVTGLNLPMLLKVLTHRSELDLNALAASACESGKAGIIDCGLDSTGV